jgi:hypothetical protein
MYLLYALYRISLTTFLSLRLKSSPAVLSLSHSCTQYTVTAAKYFDRLPIMMSDMVSRCLREFPLPADLTEDEKWFMKQDYKQVWLLQSLENVLTD